MAEIQALVILGLALSYYLINLNEKQFSLPRFEFNVIEKTLSIENKNGQLVLSGYLGENFALGRGWIKCKYKSLTSLNSHCIEWESVAQLELGYDSMPNDEVDCYTIVWQSLAEDYIPTDCLKYGEAHWYGGAQVRKQRWPLEQQPMDMQQYLGQDIGQDLNGYGAVLQRYWFSTKGVAFYVEEDVALHVGNDEGAFCLKADYQDSLYRNPNKVLPKLNYTICVKDDVLSIHKHMSRILWKRPLAIPDRKMLKYPIWSTWARYKVDINQDKVLQFVKEIHDNNFTASQIEIDDKYTSVYGDFEFDSIKFPEAEAMIETIHGYGCSVTSWIVPFANIDSKAFVEGAEHGYWIMDATGQVPGLIRWWQGIGVMLDVTNADAVQWFFRRVQKLKDLGIDSFKFDAGETTFLPPLYTTHNPLPDGNPNQISTLYAQVDAQNSNSLAEIRVGYKSQDLPIMVRMFDKSSTWDYDVGLKTVIPTALQFGIIGYPFVLPDMIGGNAGEHIYSSSIPQKELFIRWLELNAFLPAMQFSVSPWQYDQQTIDIAQKYVKLHENYISPKVIHLAEESMETGYPIVRPLWWVAPNDNTTFMIDSQFLIGNDLLVAPILDEGMTKRDIYLPCGKWKDMLGNKVVDGSQLLLNYSVDLSEIAYFERLP